MSLITYFCSKVGLFFSGDKNKGELISYTFKKLSGRDHSPKSNVFLLLLGPQIRSITPDRATIVYNPNATQTLTYIPTISGGATPYTYAWTTTSLPTGVTVAGGTTSKTLKLQ